MAMSGLKIEKCMLEVADTVPASIATCAEGQVLT